MANADEMDSLSCTGNQDMIPHQLHSEILEPEPHSISANHLFEELADMSIDNSSMIHEPHVDNDIFKPSKSVEHLYELSGEYKLRAKRSYKKKENQDQPKRSHKVSRKFICGWDMREDKTIGEPVLCTKEFNERGNLQVHQRIHSGIRPYQCQFCPKEFTTIGNRNDHERRHVKDKPYVCTLSKNCHQRYYRKYQLSRHIQ